jgi:ATP-binding cassette subfamily B protein
MRRAQPLVLTHWPTFVTALVATGMAMAIQALIPLVLLGGVDNALHPGGGDLTPYVLGIVGLALLRGIANFVGRYNLFKTAYGIEYDFRTILYEHLAGMPFSFYDRVQSGQLISRANSDIRSVQLYLTFAPMILLQFFGAAFVFVIMLTVNAELALIVTATLPLVTVFGIMLKTRLYPISWVVQSRAADVATIVDESVNGVRIVKSFAAEQRQTALLRQAARRLQWATVRDVDIRAKYGPAIENLPRLGLAIILLVGGYMALHGNATVGTIVAFSAYLLQLQAPFRTLGQVMMMGQRAKASAARIYELLDEKPDIVDPGEPIGLPSGPASVGFESVSFRYGDGPLVLDGIDLQIERGETLAVVGRTASGKSTLARLIPRFYDASSGTVRVDDVDVRDVALGELRHTAAFVQDEPFLFSVSIRENIAYGRPSASLAEVEAAARAAAAHEFIAALPEGYETVVGERGYTLSGGQRQRISLARALLSDAPVLILDDATSAVDVHVEHRIHEELRRQRSDRTTLVIAHRLSTISLADRVVVLEDGRILAIGTHAELLKSEPRYAKILAQVGAELEETVDEPGGPADTGQASVGDLDELALAEIEGEGGAW